LNRIVHWGLTIFLRRLTPARHVWRHATLWAADRPARGLIWLIAAGVIKHHFVTVGTQPFIARIYPAIMGCLVILAITWFLLRLVNQAKHNYLARADSREQLIDNTLVDAIGKLAWACVLIFAGIS